MLNIFAKPSNIEHLSLVEQKRIVITSRIALSGTILLLFYVPILAYLKQWDFLLIIIFTTIVFLIIGMLNKNGKHFIAKLLLSIEPIIHIFFVQLTQGSSVHLYNLVIVSVPFLVFNFKEQRMYCIAISLLNILCVAFCEFVNFYPQYNPFGRQEPLVWWFEYINWVGACIMVLVLVSILAFTNNENESYLLQLLEETKKLSQELAQTAEDAIQAEAKLQKANQELASREEELRQNLEELQATQESLVKEKESTAYKSELFSVVAKANEKLLTQKEPLEVVEFILSTVGKVLKMDRGYYFERDSFEESEVAT
ncbi:MAG: hypothetical protein NZ519_11255, partial [Bacteroidia bacterium]|nr:hypothetical protein [Bacteroidia bacterium]